MAINVKDKLVTVEGVKAAFDIEAEARDNADQALSDRIDNIVAPEGDPSLSEVSDARTNKNGTVYNTLKARLDADASATETEISKINGSLEAIDSAISIEKTVEVSWVNGHIKNNGTTATNSKTCVTTTFVESTGRKIVVKTISGYRSKVAHYNSSQTFVEMLYSSSEDDKTIDIPAGDYIKIQVSSDSDLTPSDIVNNAIITVSEISYTATSINKAVGISADSNDVYTLIGGMVNTNIYDDYTITSGYYSKANGNEYAGAQYARCDKKSGFGGKTIHAVVGSNYQLTIRYWNGTFYDNSKVSGYTQDGLFYVPTGYTIACNFKRVDGADMDTADLTAIKASFRAYVVSAFENFALDSGTDFNDVLDSGTYNVASSYITTYKNCPHNVSGSYGRLIVMSDANHYTCVQVYITYKNDIYTRILQLRDAGVWTKWTNTYNDTYIHDGEILRMTSTPEAIPVGSEHLGYTAFMAATWETLLPSGYTDGDAYNASRTKILNVHVSRESNWRSTAYGTNTDTYPIYRYTFTPIGGYKKTVFLSAGCHGNEAEGYWGLYRLIRMIYLEGYKYPTLRNLRDNVRFIIVPCWNPWGMQNYRRYNAFESNNLQAYRWFYATDNTITVDGTDYSINDVGEAKVIWDTITNYSDVIDLWLEIHTDPYAGRTTSAGEIDDPRGYTQPYGCYGFVKSNSRVHYRLQAVMEDFYNILLGEYNFTEKWHLVSSNGDASGAGGYSPWMASLSFPTALVEISTFMNGFPHASGSAGMMKLAQEYYANCLAELIR